MESTSSMAQTNLFKRRQFVQPREDERGAGDVRAAVVPTEEVRGGVLRRAVEAVGQEPVAGPGDQIARDDYPRRRGAGVAAVQALPVDAGGHQASRSGRRKDDRR